MKYLLLGLILFGVGLLSFAVGSHQKCDRITAWSDGSVTCNRTSAEDGRTLGGIHHPKTVIKNEWYWLN